MSDMASISAVFSSLKAATDILGFLRKSDFSIEKAEIKLKLADLVGALADAKMTLSNVQEQLDEKDKVILELQEAFENKDKIIRHMDAYYEIDEAGEPKGEPLCVRCWDDDHKKRQLVKEAMEVFMKNCPSCSRTYALNRCENIN